MPIEYAGGGVVAEHAAVRERVGVFDVSHLGKACGARAGRAAFLNAVLTNDLGRIGPGQAQYTLLCDDAGGVVDDLIAYVPGEDDVFLIPNAANTAEVVRVLADAAPEGITVTDLHESFARARRAGPALGRGARRGSACRPTRTTWRSPAPSSAESMTVCRTGYTGEHGYELVVPGIDAERSGTTWSPPARRTASCPAASARATRCAPRWATRCTARTSRREIRPVQARPAGRSAGRSRPSAAATPWWRRRRPARSGARRAWCRSSAGSRART